MSIAILATAEPRCSLANGEGKYCVVDAHQTEMFLTLLVTMLNVANLSAAWQDIIEGLIISGVLVVANGKPAG